MHRVERLEAGHLVGVEGVIAGKGAEDGQVDGIVVIGARGQRGVEDHLTGSDVTDTERITEGEGVLGQGAGLVGAQHIHTGEFLDGDQPADHRLLLGEQSRPDGHRHR